ncbi:MAG: hypothetical protein KAH32_08470, partial [Chlamydiia bacterium]|nr:hypothetical protein [Chlamydiia bacterium]
MRLSVEWLESHDMCPEGIAFVVRNKLIGYDLDKLDDIEGDYNKFISFIKSMYIKELNITGNELNITCEVLGQITHFTNASGYEWWKEYNDLGQITHFNSASGSEWWREYDSSGNEIHYKNIDGYNGWREYDALGNEIHYKNSIGFEHWKEYDALDVHYRNNIGEEYWREY